MNGMSDGINCDWKMWMFNERKESPIEMVIIEVYVFEREDYSYVFA